MILALGSNLTSFNGSPENTLRNALQKISDRGAVIRGVSPFYSTPAFPVGNGPDFVNAAANFSAPWSAQEALRIFHEIEEAMGRERKARWGERTLDLDLIADGDTVLPNAQTHAEWRNLPLEEQMARAPEELILPHPRLQDRAFVLVPLCDVAPDWVHPLLGKTAKVLLEALDPADIAAVKPLE